MKLNISELRIVEMAVKRYALERAAKLPAGHPELRQLDRFMERLRRTVARLLDDLWRRLRRQEVGNRRLKCSGLSL
jgi:hypothetical protein